VHVDEISKWWDSYSNALFTQNLRLFYFNSDVNAALNKTLTTNPEFFWYFNNGITVICDSLTKAAAGSPGRLVGVFTCDGVNIVNGAQTVGTIGNNGVAHRIPDSQEGPESYVQVRIISLAGCPPEFARSITRAANLQNAVGNREFAAMDPVQHRLATDFALDRRRYVYKTGESDPHGEEGCDIVEATQALACAHSRQLAVQVKREIGTLWADTDGAPYTELFNDELSSAKVWRCVLILRAVDEELQKIEDNNSLQRRIDSRTSKQTHITFSFPRHFLAPSQPRLRQHDRMHTRGSPSGANYLPSRRSIYRTVLPRQLSC
jgi:hypothetical protein